MKLSYYPGCSLEGTAREFDESTRAVCGDIGVELKELSDWNCCGANAAAVRSEELAKGLARRNLEMAAREGSDLLIPCVACYNRLRWARGETGAGAAGDSTRLILGFDFFSRPDVLELIKARVRRPLSGLKLACYYGCVTVRPPEVTGADRWENPTRMEDFAAALGASSVDWPLKTDCCGADLAITRPDVMKSLVGKLMASAVESGADAFAVACPLCHNNLDSRQREIVATGLAPARLPVFYFTELVGLALGLSGAAKWCARHLEDPRPLLARLGLG